MSELAVSLQSVQTSHEPRLSVEPFSAFGSITHFEAAQRMAKALCSSSIVPETYRGEQHIGDCVIALELANRIGASVLAVMQNLYIVYGRPAWSSQFLISCVNASGKFTPLRYKMVGNKGDDSWGCIAWATDRTGENLESPEVNIAMSKAEGWYQKNGSKWKTMPELMLRYRAATLFARLYAPELTMGIQTDEEVIDIAPVVTDPVKRAKQVKAPDESPRFGQLPTVVESTEPPVEKVEKATEQPAVNKADANQGGLLATQPGSPQNELEKIMESAGITFDKFRSWAGFTERLEDASGYSCWVELPVEFCAVLLKDTKSLSKALIRCKS